MKSTTNYEVIELSLEEQRAIKGGCMWALFFGFMAIALLCRDIFVNQQDFTDYNTI